MGQDNRKKPAPAPVSRSGLFSRVKSALGLGAAKDEPPSEFLSSLGFEDSSHPEPARAAPSPAAGRGASDSRQIMSKALADLMKSRSGGRQEMNYLFILNQNLMTMGEGGVRDTPHRVLFQALAQLDAAADYDNDLPLRQLRELLVDVLGVDPAHAQSLVARPGAAAPSAPASPSAAPRTAHPSVATPSSPSTTSSVRRVPDMFSEPVPQIPVPTASEIGVPELTDVAFDQFGPGLGREAQGPEVMEGHGLEPYEPVTLEDFGVKIDGLQQLKTGREDR